MNPIDILPFGNMKSSVSLLKLPCSNMEGSISVLKGPASSVEGFRDQSLITGRGFQKGREGGKGSFNPVKIGEGQNMFQLC